VLAGDPPVNNEARIAMKHRENYAGRKFQTKLYLPMAAFKKLALENRKAKDLWEMIYLRRQ